MTLKKILKRVEEKGVRRDWIASQLGKTSSWVSIMLSEKREGSKAVINGRKKIENLLNK